MQIPSRRHSPRQGMRAPRLTGRTAIVGTVVLLVVAGLVAWRSMSPADEGTAAGVSDAAPDRGGAVPRDEAVAVVAHSGTIEVPTVVGLTREEAELLLGSAGLVVSVSDTGSADPVPPGEVVTGQEPAPSTLVASGSSVVLRFMGSTGASADSHRKRLSRLTVCIDPGHQAKGDEKPEPIGPGSSKTKARVTGGATGIRTGVPEYEVNLQIATNLAARLEALGVKVVMTRTTNDVNLSNAERARLASEHGVDLTVRIHCDGSPDPELAGLSVLYPARNTWTADIVADSQRAARAILSSTVASTGAIDRGLSARGDLAGFNWSRTPVVLVECGFLSNPVEDRLLTSPHYQDRLVQGIASGVMAWATEER